MISPDQLQTIADRINGTTLSESVVTELRGEFPGIHFTYCMEDDIPNHEPLLEGSGFNLYLVDGREHCLCLTRNYEHASGIVIAEVIPE
ncbi:DUF6129 family protein [Methylomonas sp. EFPC3]|uniref:DUF6129 family protein n=1 Tax=Methylomonas aurea TaxID=2952224 RepID=A0ABT1UHN2_9GAMM|nr:MULTISPECIES: DUF6129 family protein [Methylomonas]MCQ8181741.1 DUF6129 family protein [Methylomonas sp. SURF-1]TPQ27999.1 hypothetical protein C2U68_07110 [Methylomonas koyamae]WFP50241.1 DUF6129 family protein [Methylomonas sp. EFPC3]